MNATSKQRKSLFFRSIKEKKLLLLGFFLWLLFSASMFLAYKNEWHLAMSQPQIVQTEGNTTNLTDKNRIYIDKTQVISQDIPINTAKELDSIALYLDAANVPNNTVLQIDLLNSTTNELLGSTMFNLSEHENIAFFNFPFNSSVSLKQNEHLTVQVSLVSSATNECHILLAPYDNTSHTKLHVNGIKENEIIPYQLTHKNYFQLKYFALAFYFGSTMVLFIVCISCARKKALEWIFVKCAFFLGILYLCVLPPFVVPDEQSHFATAYKESSKLIGEPTVDKDGKILIPTAAWENNRQVSKSGYLHFMEGACAKTALSENLISTRTALPSLHPGYIPQIFGITLARLLHLNSIQLLIMGRLFALIWYCFIMFWTIRFIPFGKLTIFIIGILPMTLQQIVSFNYDSVLFGLCFFLYSYLLKLIYTDAKITHKNILIIAGLIISLASLKFVYLPLLILALFIPYSKFGSKKKKGTIAGFSIILAVITILLTRLPAMQNALSTGEGAIKGTKISLGYCLQNPTIALQTFFRTIERNTSDYLFQMMGSSLGWLDTYIPNIIAVIFIIFILISTLQKRNASIQITTPIKYASILTFLGISAIIFVVLYLDWTSIGDSVIQGIQGRYFLPILPLIYIIAQNKNITIQKEFDYYIILFSTYLNCMTLYFVTLIAITR